MSLALPKVYHTARVVRASGQNGSHSTTLRAQSPTALRTRGLTRAAHRGQRSLLEDLIIREEEKKQKVKCSARPHIGTPPDKGKSVPSRHPVTPVALSALAKDPARGSDSRGSGRTACAEEELLAGDYCEPECSEMVLGTHHPCCVRYFWEH